VETAEINNDSEAILKVGCLSIVGRKNIENRKGLCREAEIQRILELYRRQLMRNIAIIPARSGSKGLKDKNIRPLNGVPLIAYTIRAAINSGMFDRIMVSTDSEEYAQIAHEWGAEVPFLRSPEVSTDTASSWAVVREVLDRYDQMGESFDTFALLQVTSPLRTGKHIVEAYDFMEQKQANAVVAAHKLSMPLEKCMHLGADLRMDGCSNNVSKPRQLFRDAYHNNGSIYICRTDVFAEEGTIFEKNCYAYLMNSMYSTDVDDLIDFQMAEAIVRYLPEFKNYFA